MNKVSINNIKRLSMNPHFYSLLIQSFLSGYENPCDIKLVFLALPILLHKESREKLENAKVTSRVDTLFQSPQYIQGRKISGKIRLSGYVERYNYLKPYCKDVLIILYSEKKITIEKHSIIIAKSVKYTSYKGTIKKWLRCAFYLGVLFSKTTNDHLSYFLGVNEK